MQTLNPDAPTAVLLLSDVHMASTARYEDGSAWWNPQVHEAKLLRFLERSLKSAPDILVLLGDIFENWLAPMEARPSTWPEIFASNPRFIALMREYIAAGVQVVFTPGNHDIHLGPQELALALPGAHWTQVFELPGALIATHGHEQTFFNSRALDPLGTHPPGYFFARLGEQRLPGGHGVKPVFDYIRHGALKKFRHPESLAHIMHTIFDFAGVHDGDCFMLEDGAVMAGDVVERYRHGLRDIKPRERIWRLLQRPTNLVGAAIAMTPRAPLVVLGHCHHERLSRHKRNLYANPGAWCQSECHAVRVLISPQQGFLQTWLVRVDDAGDEVVVRQAQAALRAPVSA